MFGKILICSAFTAFALVNVATAQQQLPSMTQQTATIKRTPLQKFDVRAPTTRRSSEWLRSCRT